MSPVAVNVAACHVASSRDNLTMPASYDTRATTVADSGWPVTAIRPSSRLASAVSAGRSNEPGARASDVHAAVELQPGEEIVGREENQRQLLEIAGLPVERCGERSGTLGAQPPGDAQLASASGADAERHARDVERAAVVGRAAGRGRSHRHVADDGVETLQVDGGARVRDVGANAFDVRRQRRHAGDRRAEVYLQPRGQPGEVRVGRLRV